MPGVVLIQIADGGFWVDWASIPPLVLGTFLHLMFRLLDSTPIPSGYSLTPATHWVACWCRQSYSNKCHSKCELPVYLLYFAKRIILTEGSDYWIFRNKIPDLSKVCKRPCTYPDVLLIAKRGCDYTYQKSLIQSNFLPTKLFSPHFGSFHSLRRSFDKIDDSLGTSQNWVIAVA